MSYNQHPLLNPGRLIDQIDEQWRRTVRLPVDVVPVPWDKLPDPDSENRQTQETLEDLEKKWVDLALHRIDFVAPRQGPRGTNVYHSRNDAAASAVLSSGENGVNRRNNTGDERSNMGPAGAPIMNGPAPTSADNIT